MPGYTLTSIKYMYVNGKEERGRVGGRREGGGTTKLCDCHFSESGFKRPQEKWVVVSYNSAPKDQLINNTN